MCSIGRLSGAKPASFCAFAWGGALPASVRSLVSLIPSVIREPERPAAPLPWDRSALGNANIRANPAMQNMTKPHLLDGDIEFLLVETVVTVSFDLTLDRRNSAGERRDAPKPCMERSEE